jgi:16S rRNA (guanine1207-N2)-methyltransferase
MNLYTVNIWNNDIKIEADPTLFSPHHADRGTMVMVGSIELEEKEKVLDLGCGAGIVGIAAAKVIGKENVVMSDIDVKAVEASKNNAVLNGVEGVKIIESDGFKNADDTNFTLILSNPPYHTDFSVAKHFIEEGKRRLVMNGRMVLVVKRVDWYKNKMTSIFGGVKVIEEDGYYVLISEKRKIMTNQKKDKPIKKKHMKKITKSKEKWS